MLMLIFILVIKMFIIVDAIEIKKSPEGTVLHTKLLILNVNQRFDSRFPWTKSETFHLPAKKNLH